MTVDWTNVSSVPRKGRYAVKPGRFNLAGELFDLDGNVLTLELLDIQPDEALAELEAGAVIAFEACGCGGSCCAPDWPDSAARTRMVRQGEPMRLRGPAPTWIDVWSSDTGRVIFLHGEYEWADAL